ncbi:hypothetical protein K440DRAFT_657287 [Wilcoxina mikolae CBS 423.85]|nr:hypothetical protein K440DRAFT_657287 [Wilcoxina mikolae CBS 423.85]
MSFMAFLFAFLGAITFTSAVPWDGALPTLPFSSPGWNPKPTAAPAVGFPDLRRRQQQTYSYDNTCGYEAAYSVTCPNTLQTCSPDPRNSVLACCGGLENRCYSLTHCINYYESSVLCGSGSTCTPQELILTCSQSTEPYCRRWTGNGYSIYGCWTYPVVASLSIPFFTSTTGIPGTAQGTSTTATKTVTISTCAADIVSAASKATAKSSCPKPSAPAGIIAGSVIGGLVVVAAAAMGLVYMLRPRGPSQPPPLPVAVMTEAPSSPYPTSQASSTPLYGNFQEIPAGQQWGQ